MRPDSSGIYTTVSSLLFVKYHVFQTQHWTKRHHSVTILIVEVLNSAHSLRKIVFIGAGIVLLLYAYNSTY